MALWGTAIQGVPNGKLKVLRAEALQAEGRLPRVASLGLAVASWRAGCRRDQFVLATALAIQTYVKIVWNGVFQRSLLQVLLDSAR